MTRKRRVRSDYAPQTPHGPRIEPLEPRWLLSGAPKQAEALGRGVIGLSPTPGQIYVGWRLLGTDDPATTAFDVYRQTGLSAPVLVNTGGPISNSTNFLDTAANTFAANTYFVRPVINGVPQPSMDSAPYVVPASISAQQYISVPIQPPAGGTNPSGSYTYRANDTSVGDLDGDGQYDFVVKWDPTDAHDSSQDGYTGNTYFDAYKLNGTKLWRIDLGRNIRAGAHYTQFIVFDLDGDGRAEVAMKTGDGTVSGTGEVIGDANADWRTTGSGRVNSGPEYLTIFDGLTGAVKVTIPFEPARGSVQEFGDNYGNRADRILMAVAYLDGQRPSLVVGRGLFGPQSGQTARNEIVAYNWRNQTLTKLWHFKAVTGGVNSAYVGQGNYEMQVADVDNDGKDEIIFGSMTVDDNGTGLYSTVLGHGDALHVSDMDPAHPGIEIYMPLESPGSNGHITANVHDAATGAILWDTFTTPPGSTDPDVGRGNAFDIDPTALGYELWDSYNPSIYNVTGGGVALHATKPASFPQNFGIWWDADPLRELEDGSNNDNNTGGAPHIDKYNWTNNTKSTLLTATGAYSNNNTKATPMLVADVLGDWREELIVRSENNLEMRIYSTTILATNRIYTLMHDTQYREAIAWQNVGYNQPPHPSFYLGAASAANDFPVIPAANVYTVASAALPTLLAPTNLTATVGGLNQIDLAWTASAGATGYNIKRRQSIGGSYVTIASNFAGTSYTDNTAANGVAYTYVVSAVDAVPQESLDSISASARVPVPGSGTQVYPAEYATYSGSTSGHSINASHSASGYHDWGYVDFPSSPNTSGFVDFLNVNGGTGGSTLVVFRYAFGSTTAGSLVVNGVTTAITFNSTGSTSTWSNKGVFVDLNPGATNTIRLQVTGSDLANVDEMTVTPNVDTTAPTVINAGHNYSTSPNTLAFMFSESVTPSIGLGDLLVTDLGGSVIPTAFNYDTGSNTATYTLPVSLSDGNYQAKFSAGRVIDGSGNAVSSAYAFDFFVLAGDANHDRKVDLYDLVIVATNWQGTGKTFLEGDFDYNGVVNSADLGVLATHWQQNLAQPAPPLPAAPTSAARMPTRTPTRVISLIS